MTLAKTVALFGWISTFTLSWLMVLKNLDTGLLTWFFWVFFFVVALFGSIMANDKVRNVGRTV